MYTEFLKMTPEELLSEAEADEEKWMRMRRISYYLIDFREDQENKKLAPKTVAARMAAIMSFYKFYDIQLPVLSRSVQRARPEMKRRTIPTKDDIRKFLKFCDLRDWAMILIGFSSGLFIIDIVNLKISDFKKGHDPESDITTLHIIRIKANYEFFTFLSPECSRALNDYLDWRNRQEPGKHVKSDNGYLS
jgi:integrase